MFFVQLEQLCNQKSIAITTLLSKLEISKSAVTRWRKGGQPNAATTQKIADYFNVTTDYLLTGSDNKKSPAKAEDNYQFALLDGAKELTDEGKKELVGYLEYLKNKYKK